MVSLEGDGPVAGSFIVSLVIELGVQGIGGVYLGISMISEPTLGRSHWWEFV